MTRVVAGLLEIGFVRCLKRGLPYRPPADASGDVDGFEVID